MTTEKSVIHQAGTADGWHGAIKPDGEFPLEAGRYHLYIGTAPGSPRHNINAD
jgi:putative glutathione S-transferase